MRTNSPKALVLSFFLLIFLATSPALRAEVPMTNPDGTINCAHPDNAITTTCGGSPPAPLPGAPSGTPINRPNAEPVPVPAANAEPVLPAGDLSQPMTKPDGTINCANPANAITTTCWAEGSSTGGNASSTVDCSKAEFKEFPVCTGSKPEAVLVEEKAKETAKLSPELPKGVDCVSPENLTKPDCANTNPEQLKNECEIEDNKSLPKCQPMTLEDGSINCAQPANAITTTCWAQIKEAEKSGVTNLASALGIDCSAEGYKDYPICTKKVPEAVLTEFKSTSVASVLEDFAPSDITVKYSGKTKTTEIKLNIDTAELPIIIKATKKGGKTITLTGITDENGDLQFTSKVNLKGYTLTVLSGKVELLKRTIK